MNYQSRRKFLKATAMAGSLFMLPNVSNVFARNSFQGLSGSEPDDLLSMGLLDVTKAPFNADPSGTMDSTKAIQDAVNEARNTSMVCFFPIGTYLISDTISCEQRVEKLETPKYTDFSRQSWWDIGSDRHYLLGSTKDGKRPVLKLSPNAKGFDDPDHPKLALHVWAQTRNDIPGTHEPQWGGEQPGISFGHIVRGIDIDISGHPGAIGLRHAGSQGCLLMDCAVTAHGAYAGFNDCPGQGGGTYNIETYGGRYGMLATQNYRYPMLAGCTFKGQTIAPIIYVEANLPLMLVGCYLESNGSSVVDVTRMNEFPGVCLVDCIVQMNKPGVIVSQSKGQNVFMENVIIKGATHLQTATAAISKPKKWTEVIRYSSCSATSENLINGVKSKEGFSEMKTGVAEPSKAEFKAKHWRELPSFEDKDAVNIKDFGASGNGRDDDSEAFKKAMKSSKKIFFPKGNYKISEEIQMGPGMQLFGIRNASISATSISTFDHVNDDTFFSHISVNGTIVWGSGKGIMAFANSRMNFTPNGGGRFYAMRGIGGGRGEDAGKLFEGTRQPITLYTLNIERRTINPQSYIRDVKGFRLFFLKAEASPDGYAVDGGPNTGNTPLAIFDSEDVRVYCATGNVTTIEQRPFIDVVNSRNVLLAQIRSSSNRAGNFPNVRETFEGKTMEIPSTRIAALFIRD
jgi:hypothetical protein